MDVQEACLWSVSPRAEVAAGSKLPVNLDQSRLPGNESCITQLARGNMFSKSAVLPRSQTYVGTTWVVFVQPQF